MPSVLDSLTIRGVDFPRRIWMSPMCQYSATPDGHVTQWHHVHAGSRAIGGVGMVMLEATAVAPEGRISKGDLGIWSDDHIEGLSRLAGTITAGGAVAGIQLAHAGAKASREAPWQRRRRIVPPTEGGWMPVAESPRDDGEVRVLDDDEFPLIAEAFGRAAARAVAAGFQVIEVHGAHGYLIHSTMSPATNRRSGPYGGSPENRARLAREVVDAVRANLPESTALFLRISATDWLENETDREGLTVEDAIRLVPDMLDRGVDLIDVSTGGLLPGGGIPVHPGYQVPFAERIRASTGARVAAVGKISDPYQADEIVQQGRADAVFIGRGLLSDPYWPRHAAEKLGGSITWPPQYGWTLG